MPQQLLRVTRVPPVRRAKQAVSFFYWHIFNNKIGVEFHSFIEWCGVMQEYLDMVEDAGLDTLTLNTHSGTAVNVEEFRLNYLAEKLNCILAPFIGNLPEDKKNKFIEILLKGP